MMLRTNAIQTQFNFPNIQDETLHTKGMLKMVNSFKTHYKNHHNSLVNVFVNR